MSLLLRAAPFAVPRHRLLLPSAASASLFRRGLPLQQRRRFCLPVHAAAGSPPTPSVAAGDKAINSGAVLAHSEEDGSMQWITTLPHQFPDAHVAMNKLRLEYVVAVEGLVRSRPSESVNNKMKTGMIEVAAEYVTLLNSVKSALPFLVTTPDDANDTATEEIRLRYRCLDLRRQQMNSNLILRHKVVKLIRRYLEDVHGFIEVD